MCLNSTHSSDAFAKRTQVHSACVLFSSTILAGPFLSNGVYFSECMYVHVYAYAYSMCAGDRVCIELLQGIIEW